MAASSKEATELCQLAKQKGVIFSVYQSRRFDGDFLTVKQLIADGSLGEILDYEAHTLCFNYDYWNNFYELYSNILKGYILSNEDKIKLDCELGKLRSSSLKTFIFVNIIKKCLPLNLNIYFLLFLHNQ